MSKPLENWRKFENVVVQIHAQMAPDARRTPNNRIVGLSGRRRQLDVTLEYRLGTYDILVVIECKKYGRRVGISAVEAFARKLNDIRGAPREKVRGVVGVMISHGGFDAGGKAIAKNDGIQLRTVAEAKATDWAALGYSNTMTFLALKFVPDQGVMVLQGRDDTIPINLDETQLFTENDEIVQTVGQAMAEGVWSDSLQRPGRAKCEMQIHPLPVVVDGVPTFATGFHADGQIVARRFDVPVAIAENRLVVDAHTDQPIYGQLTTVGVDWRELSKQFRDEDGQLLSIEEYEALAVPGRGLVPLGNDTKRFIRTNLIYTAAPDANG